MFLPKRRAHAPASRLVATFGLQPASQRNLVWISELAPTLYQLGSGTSRKRSFSCKLSLNAEQGPTLQQPASGASNKCSFRCKRVEEAFLVGTLVRGRAGTPVRGYAGTLVRRYPGTRVCRYAGTHLRRCAGMQVRRYSGTHVRR